MLANVARPRLASRDDIILDVEVCERLAVLIEWGEPNMALAAQTFAQQTGQSLDALIGVGAGNLDGPLPIVRFEVPRASPQAHRGSFKAEVLG